MTMKSKNWLIMGIILAISLGLTFTLLKKQEVHYHAGFQVYIDNELRDFSDLKYMQIEPCGDVEHEEETESNEQIEKAHLHDGVGDVVHVHRDSAVWGDLFTNIGFPIDSGSRAFINSNLVEDFLSHPIQPYESLVILSGENSEINEKLKNAVTREHIEEAEAKSESC